MAGIAFYTGIIRWYIVVDLGDVFYLFFDFLDLVMFFPHSNFLTGIFMFFNFLNAFSSCRVV